MTFAVAITVIIIFSLFQTQPQKPKVLAEQYFQFSKGTALARETGNDSILVQEVSFNVTPFGGNATHVVIRPTQGNIAVEDTPYFLEMLEGNTKEVYVQFPAETPVPARKEKEGFPLYFRVFSDQAEGPITVYVSEYYTL